MIDLADELEDAIRNALDALQDESIPVDSRAWQAECILEEALEELA